jgi:hypothetical protein
MFSLEEEEKNEEEEGTNNKNHQPAIYICQKHRHLYT